MRFVALLGAAYAVVLFALGVDRYAAHRSVEDLGIFVQSLASAFGGGFTNTIEGQNHLAVHFSPILFAIAPLLQLAHSPLALVAVQAIAGALVAPPVYLIARRRTSEGIARGIAAVALLYPPLGGVTFTEFHENGLVPAVTLWLLWALDDGRIVAAVAFGVLALAIKEDQALFVGCTGIAAIVAGRRGRGDGLVRAGVLLVALSLCTVVGYFAIVRPLAGARGPWHPLVFASATVPGADAGIVRAFTDRLGYVALALAPLLFVPLRSRLFALALPGFAETLVSRAPVTYTMGQHYAAVWIPYVLGAYALGICAIAVRDRARATALLRTSALACAVVYAVANPLHPRYFLRPYEARDARLDRFLAMLDPNVDIGTQEEAYTHFGFDPHATLGIECTPRYALFDVDFPDSNWVIRDGPLLRTQIARGRYVLARKDGGIELYERRGPAGRAPGVAPPANPYEFIPC